MSGYVKARRERFSHPLFKASKRNPFCTGYAWDWLVAHAAWKPTRVPVAGKVVTIQRGQLCYSVRFLAEAWGWSKSATERFLLRLQTETMIETDAGTGQTIITICNYDRYQAEAPTPRDDAADANWDRSGTAPGQQRDKEEEGKELKEIYLTRERAEDGLSHAEGVGPSDDRFAEFWAAYPKHQGRDPAHVAFTHACIGTDPDAIIAGAVAYAAARASQDERFTMQAARWLTERRWKDAPAKPPEPPPKSSTPADRFRKLAAGFP